MKTTLTMISSLFGLRPTPQPGGLPENSRGLRSAERGDTPGHADDSGRAPQECQNAAPTAGSGTPPGWTTVWLTDRGCRFAQPPATFWQAFGLRLASLVSLLLLAAVFLTGCGDKSVSPSAVKKLTIGVAFETLQTEYWVAGFEAIKAELKKRDIAMLEAVADQDASRQLQQVKNFITRGVDGIILVPKDAKTCIPMIRAANEAKIPIVLFNRPADKTDAQSVAVVADNRKLTRDTVAYMIEQARKTGTRHKAMVVLGDLGDINAIGRRDGFEDAVKGNESIIEVVARVPSEWNQEKAQAGVVNALQANPDIDFIFTSSDFLFPSITSALKAAGRYKKVGEPGHVILGGFDGDATAYRMLVDGYLDATGVQDVYFEAQASVQALVDLRDGKPVAELILDPGFVIHQGNLKEMAARMWGANVKK